VTAKEKKRLMIAGGVILVVIIIWLLLRKTPLGNTLINKGGAYDPNFGTAPFQLGDIPSLDYTGPRVGSRGCAVCYSGYGRIIAPSPSPPAPNITVINKYFDANYSITRPTPPPPSPVVYTGWSNTGPAPIPWLPNIGTAGR
jgi:hypothetical protein